MSQSSSTMYRRRSYDDAWKEYDQSMARREEQARPSPTEVERAHWWQPKEFREYNRLLQRIQGLIDFATEQRDKVATKAAYKFLDEEYGCDGLSQEARDALAETLAEDFSAWSTSQANKHLPEEKYTGSGRRVSISQQPPPREPKGFVDEYTTHQEKPLPEALSDHIDNDLSRIREHIPYAEYQKEAGIEADTVMRLLKTLPIFGMNFGSKDHRDNWGVRFAQQWLDDVQDPENIKRLRDEEDREFIEGIADKDLDAMRDLLDTEKKCQAMWDLFADTEWSNTLQPLKEEERVLSELMKEENLDRLAALLIEECGKHHGDVMILGKRLSTAADAGRHALSMGLDKPLSALKVS